MESVTFVQVGIFAGCLFFVLGGAVLIKTLLQRDPPLHKEYATTKSVDDLKGDVESLRRQMADGFRDLNSDRSRSIGNLHSKVESEIKQVNQRIDEIPDRIISRLKEMRSLLS